MGPRDRDQFAWDVPHVPLSSFTLPVAPPPDAWDRIAARIDAPVQSYIAAQWWSRVAPWRWSTAIFAAAAAGLALYIALAPVPPAPRFVAVLHAPKQEPSNWVMTAGRSGLLVRAVASGNPPNDHVFELWIIPPGAVRPQSLGVIPPDGVLRLDALPAGVDDNATLAISIEPLGGSPTKQPTGPVVFEGVVKTM
jgi:anti-sigma-K factor RskA